MGLCAEALCLCHTHTLSLSLSQLEQRKFAYIDFLEGGGERGQCGSAPVTRWGGGSAQIWYDLSVTGVVAFNLMRTCGF